LKGPYDDELEESGYWPLRGTVALLQGTEAVGLGYSKYVTHHTLVKGYQMYHHSLHFWVSYSNNYEENVKTDLLWEKLSQDFTEIGLFFVINFAEVMLKLFHHLVLNFKRNAKFSFKSFI